MSAAAIMVLSWYHAIW